MRAMLTIGLLLGAALTFGAPVAQAQPSTARAAQHTSPVHVTAPPHAVAGDNATPPPVATPPPHIVQTVYVIRWRPGPAWVAGLPMSQQALANHDLYWTHQAHDTNARAIAAGPFADVDGGMAIVLASSLSDAQNLAGADPGVRTHVLLAETHAWTPLIRGPRELPR